MLIFVCVFGVYCPTRELFTHMEPINEELIAYLHNKVDLEKYTLWYRYMSSSHKQLTPEFLYIVH